MKIPKVLTTIACLIAVCNFCIAQVVPIDNYSVNAAGQVQLSIQAEADKYYLLTADHGPTLAYESVTSMTMGVDGTLIISEPAEAYPQDSYTVTAHSIASPDDTDGDGIDDITEFNNMPTDAPLNFAESIDFNDGTTSIPDAATFLSLAVVEDVPWAPFLNGQQFVKFGILDKDTDEPKVYFINSNTHFIHAGFFNAIGATVTGDDGSGEIVFNPNDILPNGTIGSYSFNYSFGDAESFESTQRTFELLVANMPFLQGNMQHFIGANSEDIYNVQYADDYIGSRVNVVLESEVFAEIDYIPLNQAEGYGFFKVMTLNENPGSRDIVLYDALPNSLPRVGGIITSVIQTPLSHVNLRAIQDNVPNAYIKEPLLIDSIANLVGSYIYYRVEGEQYYIREATLDEVNAWYENLRPTEPQVPIRDLSFTEILPLDSIGFEMSTAFGAKCSNVATMRTFGFPDGTIPNGFGIPFYFYDEFMKFNDFYDEVEVMINDPVFIADLEYRINRLDEFRDDIKDAPMPQWMLDELQQMQESFPAGTSIRCRSSTNNEDLPGFSGAGLYTSKTQHPSEGHIKKSVKQVYASMWNFRAYDERDFYRVDQYVAAMGILCHPNFEDEKSNGVGVSIDPVYETDSTFYLNTQVGESLITNPDPNSIPEEILLYEDSAKGYLALRLSNLVNPGELVMDAIYLDQMRDYLKVIHDEFAILYDVVGAEGFGMDIEYKVTAQDQLVIKQARPWVSFWADINANYDLGVTEFINPQSSSGLGDSELISVRVANQGLNDMNDFDLTLVVDGQVVETITVADTINPFSGVEFQFTIPQDFSTIGDYDITTIVTDTIDGYGNNDTLEVVISKLHILEGELSFGQVYAKCGEEIEVNAKITNYGETTISSAEIEVLVNGMAVETLTSPVSIPYQNQGNVEILVTENLQQVDNDITLNLLSLNGQLDGDQTNNSATTISSLNDEYDYITLEIVADAYPYETSWALYDELLNETVATGALDINTDVFTEDICVNYGSCFSLYVYDSFGDGIFAPGNFSITDNTGTMLVFNDGDFDFKVQELFCPNGEGCAFTADIAITDASEELAADGTITINPSTGLDPYLFSIDGGQTFVSENTFSDLPVGEYMIVVQDASETCFHEETVTVEFEILDNVEELPFEGIKISPNPTTDLVTIEIDKSSSLSGTVKIEIYNYLGRIIEVNSISNGSNDSKAVISLDGYSSGSYFIKCYNNTFEQYFKVLKI